MQKVGICLLACDALLGLGDLGAGGKTLHMRELWSLGTADVPTTHTGCSPKLALGFVISLFFIFFSLNLSTSFSLLYFSHSSLQPFIHCLDCISFFPPHTNGVASHCTCVLGQINSSLWEGVFFWMNKDEHLSQFWRQNGNPHLLYFFRRETLVSAGHTCSRSNINLYERVVS